MFDLVRHLGLAAKACFTANPDVRRKVYRFVAPATKQRFSPTYTKPHSQAAANTL
ncbi:MAG: hypothetical protein HRT35_24145 [Algicola sp.]|nr:hypothetical protein [Algicola sp.]